MTSPQEPKQHTPCHMGTQTSPPCVLAFVVDAGFAPLLGVLMQSILDHADSARQYQFLVLHKALPPRIQQQLMHVVQGKPQFSVCFLDVAEHIAGRDFFTANRRDLTEAAYYRLLLPQLLPEYDRVLYLDADMVAATDLAALFDTDMHGQPLAAVRDSERLITHFSTGLSEGLRAFYQNDLYLADPQDYFNSGLLLMDLAQIRELYPAGALVDIACGRDWPFHDQDTLNYAFRGQVRFVPLHWNYNGNPALLRLPEPYLTEAQQEPSLYHFFGHLQKPWAFPQALAMAHFWPVAVRTPYYDELVRRQRQTMVSTLARKRASGLCQRFAQLGQAWRGDAPPPASELVIERHLALQATLRETALRAEANEQADLPRRLGVLGKTDGRLARLLRATPRTKLAFEMDVCGHCNLSCRGCAHFSNLCEEQLTDPREAETWLARLGELFQGEAEFIHLMGGEPLLHPKITDFFASARRHFPYARIELVTNGVLLPEQPEAFWLACRENRITICPTKYPIAVDYAMGQALAAFYGVAFRYYMDSDLKAPSFSRLPLDLSGAQDATESFLDCYLANSCIYLAQGRLYPCSVAPHIPHFNAYFNQHIPLTPADSIDIFAATSAAEILRFLSQPIPLCRFCRVHGRRGIGGWQKSRREIGEWAD